MQSAQVEATLAPTASENLPAVQLVQTLEASASGATIRAGTYTGADSIRERALRFSCMRRSNVCC
jgi:hypothetical protein